MRVAAGPGAVAALGTSGTVSLGLLPTLGTVTEVMPPAAHPDKSNQSGHAGSDAPRFCFCTGGGAIRLGGIVSISWG
jgi:hypothetical protein